MSNDYDLEMEQVYHGYMSYLFEIVKNYTPAITIEDFTEMVNDPDWDLESYIISRKISISEDRRLEDVVGKDWKTTMLKKWNQFVKTGEVITDEELEEKRLMYKKWKSKQKEGRVRLQITYAAGLTRNRGGWVFNR